MSKRTLVDVYAEACRRLDEAGARYLLIGGMGINLHLTEQGVIVLTEDCDLLLPAELENLDRAARALCAAGFALHAGGEPLVSPDRAVLAGILRQQATIRASKEGAPVDLPLRAEAIEFESAWERQVRRRLDGASVRLAPLVDIVRSKLALNRSKDRVFLEMLRDRLPEIFAQAGQSPPEGLLP